MKNLLVFKRPFTKKFAHLFERIEDLNVKYISDFKYYGDFPLMSNVYSDLSDPEIAKDNDEINYRDILVRDRYIKFIPEQQAKKLINAVWKNLNKIFSENKFDGYVGMPMDNYVLHLTFKACQKYGVKAVSPSASPLPGYVRIHNMGDYIKVREAGDEEVEKNLAHLSKEDFRPVWLNKTRSKSTLMKLYFKERAKKMLFEALKFFLRDRYSFHYNCIYPMKGAITVRSMDTVHGHKRFEKDWDKITKKAEGANKVLYYALQFTPEASLNYFIESGEFSRYEELIHQFLPEIPDDHLVIIKEHPDFYGFRDVEFYDRLLKHPNVLLVDVGFSTNKILELTDYVLVSGNASTGLEAVIKDKTVISFGGGSYYNKYMHQIKDVKDVPNIAQYLKPISVSQEDKKDLIKRILENTLPVPYWFVRLQDDQLDEQTESARAFVGYLFD